MAAIGILFIAAVIVCAFGNLLDRDGRGNMPP